MAAEQPCRAGHLELAVTFFRNTPIHFAPACPHPAVCTATVRLVWPGLVAEVAAEVCAGHDELVRADDAWVRSDPIRST